MMNNILMNHSDDELQDSQARSRNFDGIVIEDTDGTLPGDLNPHQTVIDFQISNPWPYLYEFFEFQCSQNNGNQFLFKCLKCLPQSRYYKAQKRSLYGLRSHITRKHKESLQSFNTCVSLGSRRGYNIASRPLQIMADSDDSNSPSSMLSQISRVIETKTSLIPDMQPPATPATPILSPPIPVLPPPPTVNTNDDSASHFGRLVASKLRELPAHRADEVMANILLYFSEVQKP